MTAPYCDYCKRPSSLVSGDVIYPHRPDLYSKKFWHCAGCDAYVGCHAAGNGYGDGTRPLGRLANAELRKAKREAHAHFDPLWQSGKIGRRDAYAILAGVLGISASDCHIGMFDVQQCRAVIEAKPAICYKILCHTQKHRPSAKRTNGPASA